MYRFEYIRNNELQEILKYVGSDPVFIGEEMRLLSDGEIVNYKEELNLETDNIIPLIDLYDNIFLVYNIGEDVFEKLSISDETTFGKTKTIKNYLKLLKQYKKEHNGK